MANTIKIKNSGTASAVPSSLEYGELGLNYADGKIYFRNGSNVIVDYGTVVSAGSSGASVTISDTAPSGAGVGDIWYESDTGKMFVYYDSFWVEATGVNGINGTNGATGAGVVAGGTTGQILSKIDATNYNTQWVTPTVYATTGKAIAMAIVFGG